MNENNNIFQKEKKKQDHRIIAKELELYILDEKAGQGLPLLLPNWVIIRNTIVEFLQKKQKEFDFQEVITPILGSEELYKTSGHLDHYQDSMFPAISRNNETLYLRPMTCPHHCLIYQQKPRSFRNLVVLWIILSFWFLVWISRSIFFSFWLGVLVSLFGFRGWRRRRFSWLLFLFDILYQFL